MQQRKCIKTKIIHSFYKYCKTEHEQMHKYRDMKITKIHISFLTYY